MTADLCGKDVGGGKGLDAGEQENSQDQRVRMHDLWALRCRDSSGITESHCLFEKIT
jgi:hypothetical protein